MANENKQKLLTGLASLGIGWCASSYVTLLTTAICPPIGIVTGIGQLAISTVVGTKVDEETNKIINDLIDMKKKRDEQKAKKVQVEKEIENVVPVASA